MRWSSDVFSIARGTSVNFKTVVAPVAIGFVGVIVFVIVLSNTVIGSLSVILATLSFAILPELSDNILAVATVVKSAFLDVIV